MWGVGCGFFGFGVRLLLVFLLVRYGGGEVNF